MSLRLALRVAIITMALVSTASGFFPAAAETATSPGGFTDRIIVKYKVGGPEVMSMARISPMVRLQAASGNSLSFERTMSGDAQIMRLSHSMPLEQVQAIADKLTALPEVEYAVPDQRRFPTWIPNDSSWTNQWDMSGTYGINAPAAWDITTGSKSVVIADLDTGITPHPEFNGRLVPGYDFIDDVPTANDGNGRDNNPGDPGDWVTYQESISGYFAGCDHGSSSWHGTHTAGTIGANGNNSRGVAGVNWVSKLAIVRVLGKCGGYDSDILDGMRWAAGLPVSGTPQNKYPAKVLNMSLGGPGACPEIYNAAIADINAAGAVVIVAAGNSHADAKNFAPANCPGVITVAATDSEGDRAYYSNYGAVVSISAPGGEWNTNEILSTINTGVRGPERASYGTMQGTSMAAPHISGMVSLMFSIKPDLTPGQVIEILQSTSRSFPEASSCSTSTCGSGIADAGAAVASVVAQVVPLPFGKSSPSDQPPDGGKTPSTTTLSWTPAGRATSYEYCLRQTLPCTSWQQAGNSTSKAVNKLGDGVWHWQVRAVNQWGAELADGETPWSFNVDGTAPRVTKIELVTAAPVVGDSVDFVVTFSEAVTGLSNASFEPVSKGLSGITINSIISNPQGTAWTVSLSTGAGAGTLGLKVLAGKGIIDITGNPLKKAFSSGTARYLFP